LFRSWRCRPEARCRSRRECVSLLHFPSGLPARHSEEADQAADGPHGQECWVVFEDGHAEYCGQHDQNSGKEHGHAASPSSFASRPSMAGQKPDAGHGENAFHFFTSLLASQRAIPKKPTRQPTVHTARNAGWFSKMVTPNTAVSMIRTPEKNTVTPPPRAVSPARRQWPPR